MGGPPPPGRWPLVGRDDELALAVAALHTHGAVVVTGPAGVGKTTLARAVVDAAASDGERTEWAVATHAGATVPLGAVAHLVPSEAVGLGRGETLSAIVAALEHPRGERLLLGVDDAHLLDDASAALVHLLVTSRVAAVVATVRSGEPAPDAIVALWKDGPAPLVALQALARREVDQVVSEALGGHVDGAALHFLWEASQGNGLFLRELVRDGVESGALRAEHGVWSWHGRIEPGERLSDLVAMRMGRLDDEERAVLEIVAVAESLPLGHLERLAPQSMVERLERRGLIATREGEVRLGHPMFGEVLRASVPGSRLDTVRRDLATVFETDATLTPRENLRVVLWRIAAREPCRPEQLRLAARHAWVMGALDEAERIAIVAFEADGNLEAGYLLGEVLSDLGRAEDAVAIWNSVADLPGDESVRVSLVLARSGALLFQLGRVAEADAGLRDALVRTRDDYLRRRLMGARAVYVAAHPETGFMVDDLLPGADDEKVVPTTAVALMMEHTSAGRLEQALQVADQAHVQNNGVEDQAVMMLLVRLLRAWAFVLGGASEAAVAECDGAYADALRGGGAQERGRVCVARGIVAVLVGRPVDAISALREAVAALQVAEMGFGRVARAFLALALALCGNADEAEQAYAEAEQGNRSLDGIFGVEMTRARAWVHVAAGEYTAALQCAHKAAADATAAGQHALELLARFDIARLGEPETVTARLAELAALVDGPLSDAMAAHAGALARRDGNELDAIATTFATLGFPLLAAEGSVTAASVHRADGHKARALAAARRADEFLESCQGAQTPALVRAEQADDLTNREREVAELAAAGLASKEIATRLGITARTVDNLLGRVYAKLGVSGRLGLSELLQE